MNKLHEVVVNHCFRHTFITNEVKKGTPYDVLCQMTGHVDDKMIKKAIGAQEYLDKTSTKFTARDDHLISSHTTHYVVSSSSGGGGGGGFHSSGGSSGGGHSSGGGRHG